MELLNRQLLVRIMDRALLWLFNWKMKNTTPKEREILYHHLYSSTSVKTLVHWFQIMKNCSFQMYSDFNQGISRTKTRNEGHIVLPYPTRQIRAPIAIFYGGQDVLCDIKELLRVLPECVLCEEVKNYEHLGRYYFDASIRAYYNIKTHVNRFSLGRWRQRSSLSFDIVASQAIQYQAADTSSPSPWRSTLDQKTQGQQACLLRLCTQESRADGLPMGQQYCNIIHWPGH